MDRFLMHVNIEYPDDASEARIVALVREESRTRIGSAAAPTTPWSAASSGESASPPDAATPAPTTAAEPGTAGPDAEAAEPSVTAAAPVPQEAVFAARVEIDDIHVSTIAQQYMVDLISATRYPEKYDEELRAWIHIGASPRGTIALDKCSRAQAWLNERDHVTPDDVRQIVHDALRHRVMLSYEANADGVTADRVIDRIVEQVAVA
jgi:MoxR-like ATPase